MANYVSTTSDKSKSTALILCGIGGFMGLHQFYVGKINKGFLYMCTVGLGCIGWFGDLISISLGNFRDNTGAPLRG